MKQFLNIIMMLFIALSLGAGIYLLIGFIMLRWWGYFAFTLIPVFAIFWMLIAAILTFKD